MCCFHPLHPVQVFSYFCADLILVFLSQDALCQRLWPPPLTSLFCPPFAGISDFQCDMLKMCQFLFLSTFKASIWKDCNDQRLGYFALAVCISFTASLTVTLLLLFLYIFKSNPVNLLLQQGCKLLCKLVGLTKPGGYGSEAQNVL